MGIPKLNQDNIHPFFIKQITVTSLAGDRNIEWELHDDVNVLVGANGSGKSTLINLIRALLAGPDNLSAKDLNSISDKFSEATVTLHNGLTGTLSSSSDREKNLKLYKFIDELLNDPSFSAKVRNENRIEENISINYLKDELQKSIKAPKNFDSHILSGTAEFINSDGKNKATEKTNIELISTFDMLLLSKEEFDKANGKSYSQLDFLIEKEIKTLTERLLALNKASSREYKTGKNGRGLQTILDSNLSSYNKFISEINKLFHSNNKRFKLDEKSGKFIVTYKNKKVSMNSLSSGEKQMLMILLKTLNTADKPTILLMDEPEISLHLFWQESLIKTIRKINEKCQIIVVSHSPALVMKGWLSKLVDIKDISVL